MLISFSTSNFLSFKARTTLNLAATSISEYPDNIFGTPITDLNLLKSLVIYGPNSSGKSNLFKALNFMRWFILNSSKDLQANEKIDVSSFRLSTKTVNEPSVFEIELIVNDTKYRYGFKVNKNTVNEEWLFSVKKIKEHQLFHRHGQDITVDEKFDFAQHLIGLTRDNALFLSVAAQFNNKISIEIIKKISTFKFVSGVRDENHIDFTVKMLDDEKHARLVKQFILSAGLGFTDVNAVKVPITDDSIPSQFPKEIRALFLKEKRENVFVNTTHQVFNDNDEPEGTTFLDLQRDESLGTQKYFSLAGPIIDTLVKGGVIIIDEFSSRMNPLLCESIIKLFNSVKNNPFNAQFIFVTHNLSFISKSSNVFRRDQMILFTKDKFGASEVKSLYDMRKRKDASFEKEYLNEMYEDLPEIDLSQQLNLFGQSK